MICDIDYCPRESDCTLTVNEEDGVIRLVFCKKHASALEERLISQLGLLRHQVDLRKGVLPCIIGDIQQALDYLDAQALIDMGTSTV